MSRGGAERERDIGTASDAGSRLPVVCTEPEGGSNPQAVRS